MMFTDTAYEAFSDAVTATLRAHAKTYQLWRVPTAGAAFATPISDRRPLGTELVAEGYAARGCAEVRYYDGDGVMLCWRRMPAIMRQDRVCHTDADLEVRMV